MTTAMFDQALTGLEGRARGSACTTACRPDCPATCHEAHRAADLRRHDPYYCDQIALGRDVSEYRPDIRADWETFMATLPAERSPGDSLPAIEAYREERRARRLGR
jgi:hypothetical protein